MDHAIGGTMKLKSLSRHVMRVCKAGGRKAVFALPLLLLLACNPWEIIKWVIVALEVLWYFCGQDVTARVDKPYYHPGETVTATISYHVSLPHRGLRIYMIDKMTYDTLAIEYVYPLNHTGWIIYDEFQAPYPGVFMCRAKYFEYGSESMGMTASTTTFMVGEEGPTYGNQLKIWSGDNMKGNPGERIWPTGNTGHYVAVEVVGENHTAPVLFHSDDCTFTNNLHDYSVPQQQITVDGESRYIAKTWVTLPDDVPDPGAFMAWQITATQEPEASNSVAFIVYSFADAEPSQLNSPHTHKKGYNNLGLMIEVPGDNFCFTWEANGTYRLDPGSVSDKKDVRIELDWYPWAGYVDAAYIQGIADTVKPILHTAGIDTSGCIIVDAPLSDAYGYTREDRMKLLATNRLELPNQGLTGFRYIHVILGRGKQNNDYWGICEMYPASGNINLWKSMHLSSGGESFAKPFLDSVGCFVYAKEIDDYLYPLPPQGRMTIRSAIALIIAHELGHAFGLEHIDKDHDGNPIPNVMNTDVAQKALTSPAGLVEYGKFDERTLDGSATPICTDGLNLRHLLGVDCVNSVYEGM